MNENDECYIVLLRERVEWGRDTHKVAPYNETLLYDIIAWRTMMPTLVSCKTCGNSIASDALKCPHCGTDRQYTVAAALWTTGRQIAFFFGVGAFMVLFIIAVNSILY